MKPGMVVLVVGLVVALAGAGGWIYFVHSSGYWPRFDRALWVDVVGAGGILWVVWKIVSWLVTRAEGARTSGKAVP